MAKSKSSNSRSKKKNKIVEFVSDFQIDPPAPPAIFSPTEREIALADMAYLKQKDIDSGDWAEMGSRSARWKNFDALGNGRICSTC